MCGDQLLARAEKLCEGALGIKLQNAAKCYQVLPNPRKRCGWADAHSNVSAQYLRRSLRFFEVPLGFMRTLPLALRSHLVDSSFLQSGQFLLLG